MTHSKRSLCWPAFALGFLSVLLIVPAVANAQPDPLVVPASEAESIEQLAAAIEGAGSTFAFLRHLGALGDAQLKRGHIRAGLALAGVAGISVPRDIRQVLEATDRIQIEGDEIRLDRSQRTLVYPGPGGVLRLGRTVRFRIGQEDDGSSTVIQIKGMKVGDTPRSRLYPLKKIAAATEGGRPVIRITAGIGWLTKTVSLTTPHSEGPANLAVGAIGRLEGKRGDDGEARKTELRRAGVAELKRMLAGPVDGAVRDRALRLLARLDDADLLEPALRELRAQGLASRDDVLSAVALIKGELWVRGLGKVGAGRTYQDWDELGREHQALVAKSRFHPAGPGHASGFENELFVRELERLSGSAFTYRNTTDALIDGPASFALRDQLIDGAKKRIDMMSWAIYDDNTGWETARRLVRKQQDGVKVRVIVDGSMSRHSSFDPVVRFLEGSGVDVVRWNDPDRPYDGTHRKLLVVDGKDAIAGGMNVGSVYSHRGVEDDSKWRDTDIHFQGPSAVEAERLFADLWNGQVKTRDLDLDPMQTPRRPLRIPRSGAKYQRPGIPLPPSLKTGSRVAVVNHVPGEDANVMLATMKAIRGATTSVDIEQGYFMRLPGLQDEIKAALNRGVRVRILTNSAESLGDADAVMSMPILSSMRDLADRGAEVYLRKGSQLHSKYMVVDGIYSSVGSWNPHPRSLRFEGEMAVNVIDADLAARLTEAFENDLSAETARRVRGGGDIELPRNPLSRMAMLLFPNQL